MNQQKKLWEELAKKNYKYFINTDFGRGITDEQFNRSGQEAYKKLIANDGLIWTRDTMLDYGCGVGRLTEHMAKNFKDVIGVDISPIMIAEAKKRLKGFKNVRLIETDGINIPLPENSVDFAFANHVFQHIKERDMVEGSFKEIYRVLKRAGVFKVLLRSDKQSDMTKWWSGVEYSQDAIKILYEKIGFKLIKIENTDEHAYWLWLQKYIL